MSNGQQLLAEYARTGSEPVFRELVDLYINLVHSAAVRLVNGDTHLAEDIAQTVFADFARMARSFSPDTMPGGWLHRHTCYVSRNFLRRERRRQLREKQAVEMNALEDHSAAHVASIAPELDEAINQLDAADRAAILLRFFEQRDFRTVGAALAINEDAARKRVNRALEKLHGRLKRRGLAIPAAALATTLTAGAVTAAPAGLALSISGAALANAAAGAGTTLTLLQLMSMTKLKIGIVTGVILAAVAVPIAMQHHDKVSLREENDALREQVTRLDQLAAENRALREQLAQATTTPAGPDDERYHEVLRLRGEVGRLRQENAGISAAANAPGPSPLSGLRADPEMWKMIRNQQKAALNSLYKDFAGKANFAPEQKEKFGDLLADSVMENIDVVSAVLRDGMTPQEAEQLFAEKDAALLAKLAAEFGPDVAAEYNDYTRGLASLLTVDEFKGKLTGDAAAKDAKSAQLIQLMQQEVELALANSGKPRDYQIIPTLNFRNFAFEEIAEENIRMMDSVYERVMAGSSSILSPDELERFAEFRTSLLNNVRMSLAVNRKMMAPAAK